jgi:hypothetical protein
MRNKLSLRALDSGIAQRRVSPLRIELLEERLTLSHAPLVGSQFDPQQFESSSRDNFATGAATYGEQSFARAGTYDTQSFGVGQGAEMERASGMSSDGYFIGGRESSELYHPAMGSGFGIEQFAAAPETASFEGVTYETTYYFVSIASPAMSNLGTPSPGINGLGIPAPNLPGPVPNQIRSTFNGAAPDVHAANTIAQSSLSITSDGAGWLVAGATSVAADLSGKAAPAIAPTAPAGSPSVSANQMLPADPGRVAVGPNVPQIDVQSPIGNGPPTSPAQPQQKSTPSAPPLVESASGGAVSDVVAVAGPSTGSQSAREPLLAGISADFRAVDAALQDLLSEVETLGEEIAVWFDTIKLSPWTVAGTVAVAAAGGYYLHRRRRAVAGGQIDEETSSWLFASLQLPRGQS